MADLQTLSYLGANLMLGRQPTLSQTFDPSVLPIQNGGDVNVSGSTLAHVAVGCREHFAWRTAYMVVSTVDLTAEYTVTIGGNAVVYDAAVETPADLPELLDGIATAVNASGTAGIIVTAAVYDFDGDGVSDCVRFVGKSGTAYSGVGSTNYSFNATNDGTATLTLLADALSCEARVYSRPDFSPSLSVLAGAARLAALGWRLAPAPFDGVLVRTVGPDGYACDVWPVSGLSALRVVTSGATKHASDGASVTARVTATVAPCVQESSE